MLVLRKLRTARLLEGEMISPLKGAIFSLFASPSVTTLEILTRLDFGVGSGVSGHWVERLASTVVGDGQNSATAG